MKPDASIKKCAVVFGVGASQGIGAAVCRRIAREGLWVYVVGRTQEKLNRVVQGIQNQGGHASAVIADTTQFEHVEQVFAQIREQGLLLDLVVHNVGSNYPSRFLSSTLDFFDSMWKLTFLSGFHVGQLAASVMSEQKQGTILFTGASGSLRGKPYFAAFTMGKSALRCYVQELSAQMKSEHVHVAHIIIDGMVDGDRINHAVFGLGRLLRYGKGAGGLNIDAIAENYWKLHQQPPCIWSQEIDLRPFKEKF
ncbi:SDR family NAD(P)-dependent oxidoreductase [Acinetobacter sp. WU_MDCI_Axc73]|nr:SDR family NAD(P)-dependent oxidoreductase [Acinetobacter sp. WU_MDCI_Axc73]